MNIAIVGLGLIGGSFAKAIKARTDHMVYCCEIDAETRMLARLCGAIDAPLTDELLSDCMIVFVALTPQNTIDWVFEHASFLSKKIVIDVCGVKRTVYSKLSKIAKTSDFEYIGGHPMAGRENGGFVNSQASLFDGASMILTSSENIDVRTLELLKKLFVDIGFGNLTFSTPDEHDRIIAYTSQLAHIVSGAFVQSPTAADRRGFSAGSFQDMTRVARLNEIMWTELMLDNADYLSDELHFLIEKLQQYADAIDRKDEKTLCECLRAGRLAKSEVGGN